MRLAYSLPEAAAAIGISEATLRKAINTTDPASFPPPLKAKRVGKTGSKKFAYSISAGELARWHDSLDDA